MYSSSSSSSSSADKYGTVRSSTDYLRRVGSNSSSSSSYVVGGGGGGCVLSELTDRRSRAYNSVPRGQTPSSTSIVVGRSANSNRLTDINGNVRSLSLGKSLQQPSSYFTSTVSTSAAALQRLDGGGGGGKTAAQLLLGNEKRYDAAKKRLDALYSSSSNRSSPLLNKSYNYRAAGNLSYFEKYNKQPQPQQQDPSASNTEQQPSYRYNNVNSSVMNRTRYGGGTADDDATKDRGNAAAAAKRGVVGIRNIGNTCYMNSVLQCLSHTEGLTDGVLKLSDADADGKLIRVYRDLLSRIWNECGGNDVYGQPVDPTAFKSAFQRQSPRFAGYEQQDSQEFLRLLLDRLHMDVNRVKVKPRAAASDPDDSLKDNALAAHHWQRYLAADNSLVVDLFAGQLKSTLECSVCGHKSITFEVFWDLSLSLPSGGGAADHVSLADLLDNFTQEEVLDHRERPRCGTCKADRKMYKAYSFQKLPRYLVLHLKRFQGTHSYKKITSPVQFPVATPLDMSPYVSGTARGVQPHGARYRLYAVSNHSGTPIAGHYTAFCRHPAAAEWNFFNDSSVSRVTSTSRLVSNEAYILFFEATD